MTRVAFPLLGAYGPRKPGSNLHHQPWEQIPVEPLLRMIMIPRMIISCVHDFPALPEKGRLNEGTQRSTTDVAVPSSSPILVRQEFEGPSQVGFRVNRSFCADRVGIIGRSASLLVLPGGLNG